MNSENIDINDVREQLLLVEISTLTEEFITFANEICEIEEELDDNESAFVEEMEEDESTLVDPNYFSEANITNSWTYMLPLISMLAIETTNLFNTIINYDIFYYIYTCSPVFMSSQSVRRVVRSERMDTYEQYWLVTHPNLDNILNGRKSYRAHYRINKGSFNFLVDRLSRLPQYAGSIARGGYSVEIQVACVLWRFANTHFGYRIAEVTLGVSAGSYRNFTERFNGAMHAICFEVISWPLNDPVKAMQSANEHVRLGVVGRRRTLPKVLGSIDGKLVVIQKPSENGNAYVDRKNNASLSLMAICDGFGRFMYIKVGHSGKQIYLYLHCKVNNIYIYIFRRTKP